MNMIISTVAAEKQRIEFMIEKYREALKVLPKGSLSERKIGGKSYYYLKYRDGAKIISKYVPQNLAQEVRDGIEKRRHTERMIASLNEEKKLAEKILEGAV